MTPQQTAEDRARLIQRLQHLVDNDGTTISFGDFTTRQVNADIRCAIELLSALSTRIIAGREEIARIIKCAMQEEFLHGRAWEACDRRLYERTRQAEKFADAILSLPQSTPDREEQAQPVAEGLREALELAAKRLDVAADRSKEGYHTSTEYIGYREWAKEARAAAALTPTQALDASREGVIDRNAALDDANKAFALEMDALVRTAEASPYHDEGSRNSVRAMRDASVRAFAVHARSLITNDAGGES